MNLPLAELEKLLQKEMSRKEFLHVIGAGILGVIGISGLLHNVHKLTGAQMKQARSYGSSPYGR